MNYKQKNFNCLKRFMSKSNSKFIYRQFQTTARNLIPTGTVRAAGGSTVAISPLKENNLSIESLLTFIDNNIIIIGFIYALFLCIMYYYLYIQAGKNFRVMLINLKNSYISSIKFSFFFLKERFLVLLFYYVYFFLGQMFEIAFDTLLKEYPKESIIFIKECPNLYKALDAGFAFGTQIYYGGFFIIIPYLLYLAYNSYKNFNKKNL